jgi:hypothetical protein
MADKPSVSKDASAATGTATAPSFENIDLPELSETYSDCIQAIYFDGQSLRINFGVSRLGEIKPNQTPSGKRYPCCRLVLFPTAAVELMNHMRQVSSVVTQAGVLKTAPPQPAPEPKR